MNDERWKTLISFAQFVLGTLLLGIFGAVINHQIQTREVELKEQEQITNIFEKLIANNAADKYILAQFYATVTRSDETRDRWIKYQALLQDEIEKAKKNREELAKEIRPDADAKTIDRAQAQIEKINAIVTPSAGTTPSPALAARIYFHIGDEAQRGKAGEIAQKIAVPDELSVPGVQRVSAVPKVTELRYFKLSDAVEAEQYAKKLASNGLAATTKYVPGYESTQKLRPRHYELWIASTWDGGSGSPERARPPGGG